VPKWTYPAFLALSILSHRAMQPLIALTVGDTDIGRDEHGRSGDGFAIGGSPLSAQR
jgi:hypothetical protein